ncbi:MAG: glutamate--tRNA ligase family protein [Chloroflexota bacterium]
MTIDSMTPDDFRALADLLFPDVEKTIADVQAQYPPRDISDGAYVSRFAPSPTGFLHIGAIYTSLMNRMITRNGGVYILRIEDTDQNREIEGGTEQIVEALNRVEMTPAEGPYTSNPLQERGDYGPYIQSERFDLYQIFMKEVVANGWAYPCFMTTEELDEIREQQVKSRVAPGIYGSYARSRQHSLDKIKQKIEAGEEYVMRIKAPNDTNSKIRVDDIVRDKIEMPANNLDAVLLKADGFPTYHFAHAVDDYLMGINIVLRGDEWIPSVPLHVQVNEAIGAPLPMYAHFAPIAKMDGNSRRKLSKRKDPEAAMSYYYENGYPIEAIIDYLLNLMNSSFENWRAENPDAHYEDFDFDLDKLGKASALFDLDKLTSIAKETIAAYTAEEVYEKAVEWAQLYDESYIPILTADKAHSIRVFDIERGGDKPRKDLAKWDEIEEYYGVLFDAFFENYVPAGYADAPEIKNEDMVELLDYLIETTPQTFNEDKMDWLNRMREYAADNGYAKRRKDYKNDPDAYKGWFGDMMMAFRVALTGKTHTPDLYEMVLALGEEKTVARFQRARDHFAS